MEAATSLRRGEGQDVVIERQFDAPRPLVFEMWTKPEHMRDWGPPPGFTHVASDSDVRAGGAWRAQMRGPDGAEYRLGGICREIVPPARLVFTHRWDGAEDTIATVSFEQTGQGTRVVFWQTGFESAAARDGHLAGWQQAFDRFDAHLAAVLAEDAARARPDEDGRVLLIERRFAAPPALVFKLWTEAQHLVRWWGPEGMRLSYCQMDVRPGGAWRFCMKRDSDGHEHWIHGVYREVDRPNRLVFTYVNDSDGHDMLVTIAFEAAGDGTLMHFRQERFFTTAERDGHNWGWSSTFGLLDRYIAAQ